MHMNARYFATLALLGLLLTGCISPKTFIDPTFPKVSYEDIKKRDEPLLLKLVVEFQRNGTAYPRADGTLKENAERVLRTSGVVTPLNDAGSGEIKIVMNNIADMSSGSERLWDGSYFWPRGDDCYRRV